MEKQEKKPLSQRYEVGLMVVSVIIVAALVAGISIFPEKGKEVAAAAMHIPAMLTNGQSENIASAVLQTLPFPKFAILLYLVVIILFLATTLDSCSYTLASTVSKGLKEGEEPKRGLKFVWCLIGVAIPLAITFAGTDINTIKSVVLATGLPLVIILAIIYYGFLREMKKDFGRKTQDQIIAESELPENAW